MLTRLPGLHPPDDLAVDAAAAEGKCLEEQTTTLVRKEIELAKDELTAKGKTAGEGAGMFGGAAVAGLLALGTLTALILSLLDKAMDFSLAALLVTLAYGAIAGFLALNGRKRIKRGMPPAPEQTVETVKEDVQWARSQAKSVRRQRTPARRWARPSMPWRIKPT